MKKVVLIMAMAAIVCWLPGQVLAATTLTSPLNILGTNSFTAGQISASAGDYGTVTVTLTGTPVSGVYSTATVTIGGNETPTDFDFESGYAVGIDLNTTYMTLTGNVSNGAHLTGITTSSGGNSVDSLGLFNATATVSGSNIESVTFDLTGGSWTTATEVLALNAAKIDAAGEFEVEGTGNTGYIGEIVPLPTTALLLGSGLLGLALLGLRRRGMAFQI